MLLRLDLTNEALQPLADPTKTILWSVSPDGTKGCGLYESAERHIHGFLCDFDKGVLVPGTASTAKSQYFPEPAADIGTSIRGINDAGDMVGVFLTGQGVASERGFVLLNDNRFSRLQLPEIGQNQALGINNHRVVVGGISPNAVVVDGNTFPLDPHILTPGVAQGVNQHAVVVGMTPDGAYVQHLNPGTLLPIPADAGHWMLIPNVRHGDGTRTLYVAAGISKNGTIVGFARHLSGATELHRYGFILARRQGKYAIEDMVTLAAPELAGTYWELTDIAADGKTLCGLHCTGSQRSGTRTPFTTYSDGGW